MDKSKHQSPQFISEITVEPVQDCATDRSVIAAARISTKGSESRFDWSQEASEGLIRYLMENRHGTPFEHTFFTFYVHAPIFVYREWHRHRIGVSINEESGRYKELEPVFYLPPMDRPGVKQRPGGKPGQYDYVDASEEDMTRLRAVMEQHCRQGYSIYKEFLAHDIAKEVARMCLPLNIYSSMYWSCNARSLMNFLSLRQRRTKREPAVHFKVNYVERTESHEIKWSGEAAFPSKPQWEINVGADELEAAFKERMPLTHAAWVRAGYVAP